LKGVRTFGLVSLCFLLLAPAAPAQEQRWGLGGFGSLQVPIFGFRDRFGEMGKVGATLIYTYSSQKVFELEYHYAKAGSGQLEDRGFFWAIDKQLHPSPNAKSDITFNNFLINTLFFLWKEVDLSSPGARPYLALGAGFYNYSSKVSGLIFPEQVAATLDPNFQLEPTEDTRTALGVNFGIGVQYFFSDKVALDIRGRYNLIMGELRPFELWGVKKTFPFNLIDIGMGLKAYF
jgi:hypothetical protein